MAIITKLISLEDIDIKFPAYQTKTLHTHYVKLYSDKDADKINILLSKYGNKLNGKDIHTVLQFVSLNKIIYILIRRMLSLMK